MTSMLANPTLAILVASGFDEKQITVVQRALTKAKMTLKMIAPEQGLVNGWQGNAWGHYFTVDEQISSAMGSDFDALILMGGERGVAKLKSNPHTRRIVNHFLEAEKPIMAIASGVGLLAVSPKSAGLSVSASKDVVDELKTSGASVVEAALTRDGNVLTSDGTDLDTWVETMMDIVSNLPAEESAEAVAA